MSMFQGSMTGFNAFTPASGFTTLVKSVQQVTIVLTATASNTATISAIDTAHTFLVYGGVLSSNTTISSATTNLDVTLTNSTTITATRNTGTLNATITVSVVECFPDLVSSVQYGTATISASTSGTATISSVNTSRSFVLFLGSTSASTTANLNVAMPSISLTNATTVTATVNSSTTITVRFVVVELNPIAVASVQQVTVSGSGASLTDTATISAVNTARSLMFYGGSESASSTTPNISLSYLELTNSTTVTATRTGTTAIARLNRCTVVEFAAGAITTLQRSTTTIPGTSSGTSTITAVNTNKAFLNYLGRNTDQTAGFPNRTYITEALTNSTTVTAAKSGTAGTSLCGWEVPQFV